MSKTHSFVTTVSRTTGGYLAHCLEVEVTGRGDTVAAALASVREELEHRFEHEQPPAPRQHPLVTSVEVRVPC